MNPTEPPTGLELLLALLTVLFVGLKLTHQITWSWWWVLAPVWIPFAIAAVIVCVVLALDRWGDW